MRPERDEFEFWDFISGSRVDPTLYQGFSIPVQYAGPSLDFTITAFGIPVVRATTMRQIECVVNITGVVTIPVAIDGYTFGEFEILALANMLKCFDWNRSSYELSSAGRNGNKPLRMVSQWYVDSSQIPAHCDLFRVFEWPASIIVSRRIFDAFRELKVSGATFEPR